VTILILGKDSCYPLDSRLGGLQIRSGHGGIEKIHALVRNKNMFLSSSGKAQANTAKWHATHWQL